MSANDVKHMQIGVVSELTELSIATLRHYDEVGLVPPSARSDGGFRLYTDGDVERLRTIRRMKPLGFTLDEMRELLAALDSLSDLATSDGARDNSRRFLQQCLERTRGSRQELQRNLNHANELDELLTRLLHDTSRSR